MKSSPNSVCAIGAAVLLGVAVLASGCASIVHSGPRSLTFNTDPAGARVTISRNDTGEVVHTGTTPLTVSLNPKLKFFRGQNYAVRFELAGYRTDEVQVRSELSGWYFGNLIFGGLIGMLIVDPATGAMWNLTPDQITRPLSAEQATLLKSGEGFLVTLVNEVSEAERAAMVRIN